LSRRTKSSTISLLSSKSARQFKTDLPKKAAKEHYYV
jgi:hypothetical protein